MFEQWVDVDTSRLPDVNRMGGYLFSSDAGANKFGVKVTNNGTSVTLTGTVKGYIIKPDKTTIEVNGDKSGNTAWIILPSSAYAVSGKVTISIKLINGSDITTLCAVNGYIYKTST